ncbi:hypothetical protein COOONC_04076 [Cooperia oncophora]
MKRYKDDRWGAKRRDACQTLLKRLIELAPQFRDYFGIPSTASDIEGLRQCRQFIIQAARIENFLDNATSMLGICPIQHVLSMAHRIGQIHFHRGVNFDAVNWLTFEKTVVNEITKDIAQKDYVVFLTDSRKTEVLSREEVGIPFIIEGLSKLAQNGSTPATAVLAWEKFMRVIVREMKKGFLDEALRNCREEESSE